MDLDHVRAVLTGFAHTRLVEADGDLFAVHDPDGDYEERPRQGWATLVRSDAHDTASNLSRAGVYRLNIGLPRRRFREVADAGPAEPDFTQTDVVMPHPVYADHGWVCVLNPDRSWPTVAALLAEAHDFAVRKHDNTARRRAERSGD